MKQTSFRVSRILAIIILACSVFLITCSGNSTGNRGQAAEDGLATLRSMVQDSEFSFFGYESASDVGQEELGEPLEIRDIDSDALVQSEVPNDAMIVGSNEYLFPVLVREKPIGSIRVMIDDDVWEYVAIGSKSRIEKTLAMLSANALAVEDSYLLDLEEIEMAFVGYELSGRNILIPLYTSDSAPLVPGTKYEFQDIAPYIKAAIIAARDSYNDMVPPGLRNTNESRVGAIAELIRSRSSSRATAENGNKTNKLLNVQLFPQEQNQWCWAATGKMTMLFAGGDVTSITQCAQANDAFGQDSCCDDGTAKKCNKPFYPLYENWGFTAKEVYKSEGTALSWTALKAVLDAGKPVSFLWKWDSGGGHYMVAVGYHEDLSANPVQRMVHINDPWPPEVGKKHSVTYEKWVGGPKYDNLQTCYYYDIAKK
jgi:hypothetical protein